MSWSLPASGRAAPLLGHTRREIAQGVLGDGEVFARDARRAILVAADDRVGELAVVRPRLVVDLPGVRLGGDAQADFGEQQLVQPYQPAVVRGARDGEVQFG